MIECESNKLINKSINYPRNDLVIVRRNHWMTNEVLFDFDNLPKFVELGMEGNESLLANKYLDQSYQTFHMIELCSFLSCATLPGYLVNGI